MNNNNGDIISAQRSIGLNISSSDHSNHSDEFHCDHGDLLGPFGLLVQGLLAGIAFASLIGVVWYSCEFLGINTL